MKIKPYIHRLKTIYKHPGNQGRRISAYISAVRWIMQVHWWHQPDVIEVSHGIQMRRHIDSQGARSLAYYGFYSTYDPMKFCERFLRRGDAFLDIGANIGLFTCLAAAVVDKHGRIDCIEASSKNFMRLQENISLNKWQHVYPQHIALGPKEGFVNFPMDADEVGHIPINDRSTLGKAEKVRIAMLDDVLPEEVSYTLGKLDIEGFELPCLRGAQKHLQEENPPIWFFEVNGSSDRYGFDREELFAYFRSFGFRLGKYDAIKHQIDFSGHLWDDVIAISPRGEDLLTSRLPDLKFV